MATDDDPLTKREGFELVAGAAVSAATAIAAARMDLPPNVVASMAVLGPALSLAVGRGAHHTLARRLPWWSAGFAKIFGSAETAQEHFEQLAEDPNHNDVIYRSFRQMLDAADDSVIDALGRLAGQYSLQGKKPDDFFRGLGGLLCELVEGEIVALTELLDAVNKVTQEKRFFIGPIHLIIQYEKDPASKRLTEQVAFAFPTYAPFPVAFCPQSPRLFALMKRYGIAGTPGPDDRHGVVNPETRLAFPEGDRAMSLPYRTLEDLLSVLSPKSPA